ncbi:YbaB/EbfC family nucleoid-associated protein [Actinokineospora guangxiensis]|uniref:YbaB/EbfC family nucleoid-associated protein n=1 Tax=Actinokineospora guangxiensis TaxID=1490288 RepID=A0ABW0ETJ3_9PSEU
MDIDIDRELDSVAAKVERTSAEAAERLGRFGPVSGRASSGDGGVTVEVKPGGLPTEIVIAPHALRQGSEALAAQIMAVAAHATRRAGGAMHAALAPVLGPGGEKHLASLGYEPVDEDDSDADYDNPLGTPPGRLPGRRR